MNKHCIDLEHSKRVMGSYDYCTVPHCGFYCLVYHIEGEPINPREGAEAVNEANWVAFNTPRAN